MVRGSVVLQTNHRVALCCWVQSFVLVLNYHIAFVDTYFVVLHTFVEASTFVVVVAAVIERNLNLAAGAGAVAAAGETDDDVAAALPWDQGVPCSHYWPGTS